MTWRNESAGWYNAHVANRTWIIGPAVTSDIYPWYSSTTIYPANVSTYKLCDGTPRVNVRPITKHWSGNSTAYMTFTKPLTPQYRSQPCTPDPEVCRIWYYDSNIQIKDDHELVRQCGMPAHEGAPCLIGGGPVQLVYFPVSTIQGNLCGHNGSTFSIQPTQIGSPATVTTLGHAFTSGSVYLFFQTLYASYDGFWDRIGPTFSNYILPLPSSAISTQCDGWGRGTSLDYADLNWPVPASAYSCQNRCSVIWTSECSDLCSVYTKPNPPECNTIWSDVDPTLAVPTQVKDLASEWSTCSFWDFNIPNFWFDPPIALQQQTAMATPTMDPTSVTTAAAPSSTVRSPYPRNTATAESRDPSNTGTAAGRPDPAETASRDQRRTKAGDGDPGHTDTRSLDMPRKTSQNEHAPPEHTTSARPTPAAAVSILAHALSSNVRETDPAMRSMVSAAHAIASSLVRTVGQGHPNGDHSVTGAVITLSGKPYTAVQSSDNIILGSTTLGAGQHATISGQKVSVGSSEVVVGTTTAAFTALPAATNTAIAFSPVDRGQHDPSKAHASVLAAGSLTLTESAVATNAVVIDGTTLTVGGQKATISGNIISQGSSGLVLLHSEASISAEGPLPQIVSASDAGLATLAIGSLTFTVASVSGATGALSVGGTILSKGGPPAVVHGVTLSDGASGLVMLRSSTTAKLTTVGHASASRSRQNQASASGGSVSQSYYPEASPTSTSSASCDRASGHRHVWILGVILAVNCAL